MFFLSARSWNRLDSGIGMTLSTLFASFRHDHFLKYLASLGLRCLFGSPDEVDLPDDGFYVIWSL